MKNLFYSITIIVVLITAWSCSFFKQNPNVVEPEEVTIDVETVVEGLGIPWGIDFLPNGDMLIAEKEGKLSIFKDGQRTELVGEPEIYLKGQGGLMDVKVHPKYDENGWIYISYACKMEDSGGNTAMMRFKLDGNQIVEKEKLFQATPASADGRHFGSRIEFDNNGYLFLGVGERGNWDNAQMLSNHSGKVHRFNDDGTIPDDNPFFNEANAQKSIYSYGHRNPQGMVLHPTTGELWEHEHGPMGGDEINIVEKGKNYGWPLISFGINYNGQIITEDTARAGLEQPILYWKPSIAPSGMAFISSDVYGDWKGDLLVGSLRFNYVNHCVIKDGKVIKQEKIVEKEGRVREIKESPDGYIYVGVESGKILKLVPKTE
jgi:glucose/arabinose dehydrogenase